MLRSSTTLPFQFIRDGMFNSEKTYVLFSGHIKDTLILDCRSLMRLVMCAANDQRLSGP